MIAVIILILTVGLYIFRKHPFVISGLRIAAKYIIKRPFSYLIFAGLSILSPYFSMLVLIIITGDRIEGMQLGVFPGLIIVHIVYGLLFINYNWIKKVSLTLLLSILILGLVKICATREMVKTNWDIYGFWDLTVTNFVIGLIVWETFFQLNNLATRQRIREK